MTLRNPEKASKRKETSQAMEVLYSLIGGIVDLKDSVFQDKVEKTIDEELDKKLSALGKKLNSTVGGLVQNSILPSQAKWGMDSQEHVLSYTPQTHDFTQDEVAVNDAKIPTYSVDGTPPGTDPKDKKYIIFFPGNGEYSLSYLELMREEAKKYGCVVVSFDYPGVGNSTGKTKKPKDLVDAGFAQVERLTQMGIPPGNIILKGQSLGGGVATMVAAKCHEKDKPVYLFNQRSFSKLSKAANHLAPPGLGKIFEKVVKAVGWEVNSKKAWDKIPETHKDLSHAVEDRVIPTKVSLAKAVGMHKDKSKAMVCGHNDELRLCSTQEHRPAESVFDRFVEKCFNIDLSKKKEEKTEFENPAISEHNPAISALPEHDEEKAKFEQAVQVLFEKSRDFQSRKQSSPRDSFLISDKQPPTLIRELQRQMVNLDSLARSFSSEMPTLSQKGLENFKSALSKVESEWKKFIDEHEEKLSEIPRYSRHVQIVKEVLESARQVAQKLDKSEPQMEKRSSVRRLLDEAEVKKSTPKGP